jgi:hypothetical protein
MCLIKNAKCQKRQQIALNNLLIISIARSRLQALKNIIVGQTEIPFYLQSLNSLFRLLRVRVPDMRRASRRRQ